MKINFKETIFWIFLIIAIILLIWNIFGNSPSEFITIVAILFTVLLKVMLISERLVKLETKFYYLARDFKEQVTNKRSK